MERLFVEVLNVGESVPLTFDSNFFLNLSECITQRKLEGYS